MVLGGRMPFGAYCNEIELASSAGRRFAVEGGVQDSPATTQDGYSGSTEKAMGPNPPIGKALGIIGVGAVAGAGAGAYAGYRLSGNVWVAAGSGVVGLAAGLFGGAQAANMIL